MKYTTATPRPTVPERRPNDAGAREYLRSKRPSPFWPIIAAMAAGMALYATMDAFLGGAL